MYVYHDQFGLFIAQLLKITDNAIGLSLELGAADQTGKAYCGLGYEPGSAFEQSIWFELGPEGFRFSDIALEQADYQKHFTHFISDPAMAANYVHDTLSRWADLAELAFDGKD